MHSYIFYSFSLSSLCEKKSHISLRKDTIFCHNFLLCHFRSKVTENCIELLTNLSIFSIGILAQLIKNIKEKLFFGRKIFFLNSCVLFWFSLVTGGQFQSTEADSKFSIWFSWVLTECQKWGNDTTSLPRQTHTHTHTRFRAYSGNLQASVPLKLILKNCTF